MWSGEERGSTSRDEIARWVEQAAAAGEPDFFPGKRHAKRFTEGMPIDICLSPPNGPVFSATMHNVSETGVSFWTRRELSVGQLVYLREFSADGSRPWVPARIRHRTRSVQGYLLGLVFA